MAEKEYIEREATLEAIKNEIDSIKSNYSTTPYEFVRRGLQMAYSIIENVFTADVQEISHGKWCHIGGDEWCCDCCGYVVSTEGSWEKPTEKYCSECGAKMDKE